MAPTAVFVPLDALKVRFLNVPAGTNCPPVVNANLTRPVVPLYPGAGFVPSHG